MLMALIIEYVLQQPFLIVNGIIIQTGIAMYAIVGMFELIALKNVKDHQI